MLDFAQEWRNLDKIRRKPDEVAHWDKRAETYTFKDAPGSYVRAFIEKMNLSEPVRILDMGCGTGSLAVPLAQAGHQVIAADFSEGMLNRLRENAACAGVLLDASVSQALADKKPAVVSSNRASGVIPLSMSWEDNWSAFGLNAGCVDVALASRSVITHDLEDSLRKLSAVASSKVCVTAATGYSPRVDVRAAKAMGLRLARHNDAAFVFGIAGDLGYEPNVSYIHSARNKTYASREAAFDSLMETMRYVDDRYDQVDKQLAAQRLNAWLDQHLVPAKKDDCSSVQDNSPCSVASDASGTSGLLQIDEPRIVPWAFISWDV